jgi:hypothetical protein
MKTLASGKSLLLLICTGAAWLAACTPPASRLTAPSDAVVFDAEAAPGAGSASLARRVTVTEQLGALAPDTAPTSFDALGEGQIVLLDVTLAPAVLPQVRRDGEWRALSADCQFGPVSGIEEISVPTGSNHLLMSVLPGEVDDHPANFISCDYAPAAAAVDNGPENMPLTVRVKGCYLVHESAIPTARQLVLHPAPGPACDLY